MKFNHTGASALEHSSHRINTSSFEHSPAQMDSKIAQLLAEKCSAIAHSVSNAPARG